MTAIDDARDAAALKARGLFSVACLALFRDDTVKLFCVTIAAWAKLPDSVSLRHESVSGHGKFARRVPRTITVRMEEFDREKFTATYREGWSRK